LQKKRRHEKYYACYIANEEFMLNYKEINNGDKNDQITNFRNFEENNRKKITPKE
jgi:hypothetical protein